MRPKVVLAVSSSVSLRLMAGWPEFLEQHGFTTVLLAAIEPHITTSERILHVPFARSIFSPIRDMQSLLAVLRILRQEQPQLVEASTPKAGLLTLLAARLTGVPRSIYLVRGLRYETATGVVRAMLLVAEHLSCSLASHVLCVSESVRERLIADHLAPPAKLQVLLRGSSNGVDTDAFRPGLDKSAAKRAFGLSPETVVGSYLGRVRRDKGVLDLVAAFSQVYAPAARLLIVGSDELSAADREILHRNAEADARILLSLKHHEPRQIYAASDFVVLPTYREGFPNIVLEANACGLPVIGSDATGVRDAVLAGETGLSYPVGDSDRLAESLRSLIASAQLRERLGGRARDWVVQHYSRAKVWQAKLEFIRGILQ